MVKVGLVVVVLVALVAAAAPAAAKDLFALTDDERIVRLAPDQPGTLRFDRPVSTSDRDELLGLTWFQDDLWALSPASRIMLDLTRTPYVATRWYPVYPASLAGIRGFALAPSGLMVGTTATDLVTLDDWPNGGVESSVRLAPPGLDLVASAFDGAQHFAIDAATDSLVRNTGGGSFAPVGPLGIPVGEPAGLEIIDGVGYLASEGTLHRVDLATGAATAIGPIGAGEEVLDLAVTPPPSLFVDDRNVRPYVGEPEGQAVVTLMRRGDPDPPMTVRWSLVRYAGADAAEPGQDYVPAAGTATLAPGQGSTTITFPLIDDDELEGPEWIGLRLEQDGGPKDQRIWLWDDQSDAEFAVGAVTVSETAGSATIPVRRSPKATGPGSIAVAVGGSATPGADFDLPARIDFAAGETAKELTIPIRRDATAEPAETIELELTAPGTTRAVNPRRRATVTIDDGVPGGRPRDTRAPSVRLLGTGRTRLARTMTVRLRCSEACSATASLALAAKRARRLGVAATLARGTARAAKAGPLSLRLALKARTLARLRRAAPEPLTLRVTVRDPAGNVRTARLRLVARR